MEISKSGYLVILGLLAAYSAGAVILMGYVLLSGDITPEISLSYTVMTLLFLNVFIVSGFFIVWLGIFGGEPSDKMLSIMKTWTQIVTVLVLLHFTFSIGSTLLRGLLSGLHPNQVLIMPLIIIIIAVVLYHFSYSIVRPVSDEQLHNPRTSDFELDQTYGRSFDLCLQAVGQIDWNEIRSADKETGIITATIQTSWTNDPSELTVSLQKTDTGKTHVRIFSTTTPSAQSMYMRTQDSTNQISVGRISEFLKKNVHKTDKEIAQSLYVDPLM